LAPTVEITATRFCYPGGILQLFHRQDQQILRLPAAAAAVRSLQQILQINIIINEQFSSENRGSHGRRVQHQQRVSCNKSVVKVGGA
jgi:hypothetical protein